MDVFVIYRSCDEGVTQHQWWPEEGYNWVESGALAKWFRTSEEAEQFSTKIHRRHSQIIYVGRYDPVKTLLNPTAADKAAMQNDHLKRLLAQAGS